MERDSTPAARCAGSLVWVMSRTLPQIARLPFGIQHSSAGRIASNSLLVSAHALYGQAAAAYGRAPLERAGVGRPRLEPTEDVTGRSPRRQVRPPQALSDDVDHLAAAQGRPPPRSCGTRWLTTSPALDNRPTARHSQHPSRLTIAGPPFITRGSGHYPVSFGRYSFPLNGTGQMKSACWWGYLP